MLHYCVLKRCFGARRENRNYLFHCTHPSGWTQASNWQNNPSMPQELPKGLHLFFRSLLGIVSEGWIIFFHHSGQKKREVWVRMPDGRYNVCFTTQSCFGVEHRWQHEDNRSLVSQLLMSSKIQTVKLMPVFILQHSPLSADDCLVKLN